jgi:hypothetical protein
MPEYTVCSNFTHFNGHLEDVKYLLKEIDKSNDIKDIKKLVSNLEATISTLVACATDMHQGGKAMEARLMLYRSAIESLGFARV